MRIPFVLIGMIGLAAPALGNSLVPQGPTKAIAKSTLSARPDQEWNRLSARPGKRVETWTLDGPLLNAVQFYAAVPVGEPLLREADKKREPLPKVAANMLLTDIPAFLESTYRAQRLVSRFDIETQEPIKVAGETAVRFTYRFVRDEADVQRSGEAIGFLKSGRLYLVTYEAPSLHFFAKDLPRFRQLVDTLVP